MKIIQSIHRLFHAFKKKFDLPNSKIITKIKTIQKNNQKMKLFPNKINYYGFFQVVKSSSSVNIDLIKKFNGNNLRSLLITNRKK